MRGLDGPDRRPERDVELHRLVRCERFVLIEREIGSDGQTIVVDPRFLRIRPAEGAEDAPVRDLRQRSIRRPIEDVYRELQIAVRRRDVEPRSELRGEVFVEQLLAAVQRFPTNSALVGSPA